MGGRKDDRTASDGGCGGRMVGAAVGFGGRTRRGAKRSQRWRTDELTNRKVAAG